MHIDYLTRLAQGGNVWKLLVGGGGANKVLPDIELGLF